ncbi:MAG: hypothetical protein PHU21_06865, partial [Elusimicrobia bacterium]|nr:hypothetical protein [Elusimicrobiota bacterium]
MQNIVSPAARAGHPPALLAAARGVLKERGWVLSRRRERFSVRRRGEKGVLFELVLEARGGAAGRQARSILPVFHLRPAFPRGGRRLAPDEAAAVQRLASGLCLLLESR